MASRPWQKRWNMMFDRILAAQQRGEARGIPSICSAHPWVLRTAMRLGRTLLVESTCNQVNQFGGYTGMRPADFVAYLRSFAAEEHFPEERILFGGDHLGPSVWQNEPAAAAIRKAGELLRAYVRAGYGKLHLDCSMRLADDPPGPLDPKVSAARAADLALIAETAQVEGQTAPCYVIGTEVPVPGGATEWEKSLHVTAVEDAQQTIEITRRAFQNAGLEAAWERVIALVVQPGVEFGDGQVFDYNPAAAAGLSKFIEGRGLVYEAHSTDYQQPQALIDLVRDHFAILKVGPALTFAYREAVFLLTRIEEELFPVDERSNLLQVLEQAMLANPEPWQKHYHGDDRHLALARRYSLSDRIRYYWFEPHVQAALGRLMDNLKRREVPLGLWSQYAPQVVERVQHTGAPPSAGMLIEERIAAVLRNYHAACAEPDQDLPAGK